MARLDIRGRIMAHLGTQGLQYASVEVIDVDQGGNGDDVIFSATTDGNGYFQGTSSEWVDRNTIRVPRPWPLRGSVDVDVPDVLALKIRVRLGGAERTFPFFNPPGGQPVIPVFTDLVNPRRRPTVNGEECSDGYQLQVKTRAALERGDSHVTVTLYGPDAMPFVGLANRNLDQLRALAAVRLPGVDGMLYSNPIDPATLAAIALVILAIGAAYSVSVIATAVAFALILALVLGYRKIWVDTSTAADGTVQVNFHLEKV